MYNRDYSEKIYIFRRKVKAYFVGLAFYVCRVFPIRPRKVVMWTMEGKGGYGDSPKYIAEEMIRREAVRNGKFEIVWLTNCRASDLADKEFPDCIKVVKNSLWSRAYHFSTAGFWVGNTRTSYGTKKRRKTIYIQTWHAIVGIKPIGKFREDRLPEMARIISEYDSQLIDYVLSGNEWSNKMWPDGLLYYGPILKTGIPRCDVLLLGKEQMHRKYREKYGLPDDVFIMLYAPTFRGGSQNGKRSVSVSTGYMDFRRLVRALEMKFGGTWYVFFRLHPQVARQRDEAASKAAYRQGGVAISITEHDVASREIMSERVIDVSGYPDMNELIVASDMFLTDYSSSVFESAIMKQPGFLFVEDEKEYVQDRGKLLFRFEDMPFPMACNMDELERRIADFDQRQYEKSLEEFMIRLGIFEDGNASSRVVDFMEKKVIDKNGDTIYE